MVGEHAHVALAGGIVQRRFAADRLVDAHRGVERPRHQRQLGDGLAAERQALRGDRIVGTAVGKPFVGGRCLEDRHLFLEDVAVVVIGGIIESDVNTKHVRFALFGAATEATEQPPASEHVGEGVVLGKVERVPGGQHVNQRAEADAVRVLGQHRVQK
jgi:hypothetical protein